MIIQGDRGGGGYDRGRRRDSGGSGALGGFAAGMLVGGALGGKCISS